MVAASEVLLTQHLVEVLLTEHLVLSESRRAVGTASALGSASSCSGVSGGAVGSTSVVSLPRIAPTQTYCNTASEARRGQAVSGIGRRRTYSERGFQRTGDQQHRPNTGSEARCG